MTNTKTITAIVVALRATSDVRLNDDFATLAESTGVAGANTMTVGIAWDSLGGELTARAARGSRQWSAEWDATDAARKARRDAEYAAARKESDERFAAKFARGYRLTDALDAFRASHRLTARPIDGPDYEGMILAQADLYYDGQ